MDEDLMLDQQEQQQQEETQAEVAAGELTLDDTGALNIPEDFWDDPETEEKKDEPASEEAAKEPSAPAHYSKEELAEAFVSGNIDAEKVPPELKAWYEAIEAASLRKREAERADEEARLPVPQPVAQPMPPAPQQTPAERYQQAREAAKQIAARNYLGIDPGEVDEFNPQHAAAVNQAMQDIRDVAAQIQQRHIAAQAKLGEFAALYQEFGAREPEMARIDREFFPRWRENLTWKEANAVDQIIAGGDIGRVRALMERVVADYKKGSGKPAAQTSPVKAVKAVESPPPVVSARGAEHEEAPGMVDVSKMGDMTPDELAKFLLEHKFAEV